MKHALRPLLLAALLVPPAAAQTLEWQRYGYDWASAVDLTADVDGDGLADVIIGDPLDGVGGEVTVCSGVTGLVVRAIGGGPGAKYGIAVAGIPDLNGDGYDEFGFTTDAGELQVQDGATNTSLHGYLAGAAELSLAVVGDLNGDGRADVALGLPDAGSGGQVRVVSGRYLLDGTPPAVLWSRSGAYANGLFGEAVAGVGDVDGDGVGDVAAGGPEEAGISGLFSYHGQVHCLSGATGATLWTKRYFDTVSTRFGAALAGVGDLNGDGVPDVAAGAPWNDAGALDAGAAFVLSGVHGGFLHQLYHGVQGDFLGSGVAGVGDVDQDGTPDLLIGADGAGNSLGSARFYSGATLALVAVYPGVGFQGRAGTMSGGADATGDGLPDFTLASPGGGFGPGRVELWSAPCLGGHTSFCTSTPNSFSGGGTLHVLGSVSLSENDMTLEARHCPPNQPGFFFYGDLATQVPAGDGYRCVGGGIYRLLPVTYVDPFGFAQLATDFTAPPLGTGPGAVMAGDTRYFQYWFRDPQGPGGSGSNFTNGQAITFCH